MFNFSVELGHYLLILGLFTSILQTIIPLYGWYKNDYHLMQIADSSSIVTFIVVVSSFGFLIEAFYYSDFSLSIVWENSSALLPNLYKITGAWSNHEGSFLLSIVILTLFSASIALFANHITIDLKSLCLSFQGLITTCFISYILFTSNPFTRLSIIPQRGQDINPLLQDIGLAIHPPLLYLGYMGFSTTFSFTLAGLVAKKINLEWANYLTKIAIVSWIFITLGITMGSFWAYYELGWGGWWFWDPVENISLLPWISGTALIHSITVFKKRKIFASWTILLAIMTFSYSLLGTFIVRSGLLASVHAFASDPLRGIYILGLFLLLVSTAFVIFIIYYPKQKNPTIFTLLSKEAFISYNNLAMVTATIIILTGTLYPTIISALFNKNISVGSSYYNTVIVPLIGAFFILIPFGVSATWKKSNFSKIVKDHIISIIATFVVFMIIVILSDRSITISGYLGCLLGVWIVIGSIVALLKKFFLSGSKISNIISRIKSINRANWASNLAHIGVGILIIGISADSGWPIEKRIILKAGQELKVNSYTIKYNNTKWIANTSTNYQEKKSTFLVSYHNQSKKIITSSRRYYPLRETSTTEAGIMTNYFDQLYISADELTENGLITVIRIKYFILFIWLGGIVIAASALLLLLPQRKHTHQSKKNT